MKKRLRILVGYKGGFCLGPINYFKKLRDDYIINQVNNIKLPDFETSPMVRKRIIFSGRVQNVGFRFEVCLLAKRLKLTGWVKNRRDKSVEAEIQGENAKIIFLIKFMESLKRASVRNVEIDQIATIDNEIEFTTIRD